MGRPAPAFREHGEVIVTFAQGDEAIPDEDSAPASVATETTPLPRGRAARQEAALRYVQEHGTISNKVYRALTGVSAMTVVRDLEMLVEQGALRVVGHGRSQRYTR